MIRIHCNHLNRTGSDARQRERSFELALELFRFRYRTVGRQPLDDKYDYAHDPEEEPRILRRPVKWDERQND